MKTLQSKSREPAPPAADRTARDTELLGNDSVMTTFCAPQNDPCSRGQRLSRLLAADVRLEDRALFLGQRDGRRRELIAHS